MEFTFTAYDLDEDGNWINERDDTPKRDELGRIAAQTFRQVMSQRIREVERDRKFEEYANREGDIVTGIIQQTDTRYTLLDLGRVEALLPQAEQVPFERPQPGDRSKAYIVEVRKTAKGPQIVVSRTHPGLIKRLFELEVPEIADGIVEIKACAREPGHRTKIAVWSNDHNVDPVGACVGARGGRVRMVVNELRGEKIDIVPFSDDLPDFVAKALSPAKVIAGHRRRRRHAGRRHRARPPAQPGDRPRGPERPPRGPPHRCARRHPLRDPARRRGAGAARRARRRRRVRRGRVGRKRRHRRDGVARRRRHGDEPGRVGRPPSSRRRPASRDAEPRRRRRAADDAEPMQPSRATARAGDAAERDDADDAAPDERQRRRTSDARAEPRRKVPPTTSDDMRPACAPASGAGADATAGRAGSRCVLAADGRAVLSRDRTRAWRVAVPRRLPAMPAVPDGSRAATGLRPGVPAGAAHAAALDTIADDKTAGLTAAGETKKEA